ncbi:carboxypeptidase family protein [Archangium gephyra]|uniref:Carboxypeptidase family protein n=1 Tax=Archangium gephyra TaxID=48 RepID=A0ABX9JYW1_9BACT|nr:TonB-dependent receptor [Archangium gephyra]REG29737.1 carboxypeptidase family protein [Archangium gephyra]
MNRRLQTTQARVLVAALTLGVCMWMPPALAQQSTSVLTGTVVDASNKQPVADVVVTATSPSLQGEQIAVTDATGLYRLPQLPPGIYTVRFEKEAFQVLARDGVTLRLNSTVRFNAELLPEGMSVTVDVVAAAPAVDVGSTRTGVSVDTELMNRLAVVRPGSKGSASRSFESLAELAPGANADAYGVSIGGTTSPENGFLVDGLSTGNPALGILGTPLSAEFIQEVNVITGGFMPEFGRSTGGVMTAVTKSGSNQLHGSVFGNLAPGFLEGTPTPIAREGTVITTRQQLWNLGDFGATLGGPLVQDKLWFFAGVAPSFTRRVLDRSLNAFVLGEDGKPLKDKNGFSLTTPIPNGATRYFADQRSVQYLGKLTWQVHTDHSLSLSVYGTPSSSGGEGRFGYNIDNGAVEVENLNGAYSALAHSYEQDARDISLKLTSSFLDKRVLLDANVGWHHQYDNTLPVDGSGIGQGAGLSGTPQFEMRRTGTRAVPTYYSINDFEQLADPSVCDPAGTTNAVRCPVANYLLGGPGFLLDRTVNRYQANAVGTLLLNALGHHVIKAGLDAEVMTNVDTRAYSGRRLIQEATDGKTFTDFRAFGFLTGPDQVEIQPQVDTSTRADAVGAFLQDSWSIMDRVTLNAGLRYDTQTIYGTGGDVAFELPNQLSPRVGLVYDFTQKGRSKLFASYARYYQNAVLAMVNSQFSNITRIRATRSRAPLGGGPGCDPLTQAAPYTDCADTRNIIPSGGSTTISRLYNQTFAINSPVDPDLKPQSSDELVVGAEYEVVPRGTLGASYTRRYMNDVIEDMSINETTNYFIGNPGRGIAESFDKAVRDYDAVSVYFNKAFADLWLVQASYTWSSLRGNYSGLYRPDANQLAPNVTSDFDLVSMMQNKEGPLPLDRTHAIKVFGAREFVFSPTTSLDVGLSYRGTSGAPLNVQGTHYLYGAGNSFILPRGSGGRLPWVHNVDAHVGFNYKLGRGLTGTLTLDSFNLFNFQAVTSRDQNYTFDNIDALVGGKPEDLANVKNRSGETPALNPNYGKPLSYQTPRSIRFGARVTF